MDINIEDVNYKKYIKYKKKYLELKQTGGGFNVSNKSKLQIYKNEYDKIVVSPNNTDKNVTTDSLKRDSIERYFHIHNNKNNSLINDLKNDNSNFEFNNFSNLITIAKNNIEILFDTTGPDRMGQKKISKDIIVGYHDHIKSYINTHLNRIQNKEILIELLKIYFDSAQYKVNARQLKVPNSNQILELPLY
jgi:hypothetical protein